MCSPDIEVILIFLIKLILYHLTWNKLLILTFCIKNKIQSQNVFSKLYCSHWQEIDQMINFKPIKKSFKQDQECLEIIFCILATKSLQYLWYRTKTLFTFNYPTNPGKVLQPHLTHNIISVFWKKQSQSILNFQYLVEIW